MVTAMNNKIDIIGKLTEVSFGVDYTDRYFRQADFHTHVFEQDKQRYVWQSKSRCEINLTEGSTYHLKAVVGDRLLGGRGISITDVELLGEMAVSNKLIQLIIDFKEGADL
jgi:hypothetical protein